MEEVKIGEWYFGVSCKSCHKPILLFHDPSKGKVGLIGPEATLKVTCPDPKCGHEDLYPVNEVQRFVAELVH